MMARLVRQYGMDPERVFTLPRWMVAILLEYSAPLQAAEEEAAARAALMPALRDDDRADILDELRRLARRLEPEMGKPVTQIIEQNPAAAAEWFAALGAHTEPTDG
jgi:hypothetical protein